MAEGLLALGAFEEREGGGAVCGVNGGGEPAGGGYACWVRRRGWGGEVGVVGLVVDLEARLVEGC